MTDRAFEPPSANPFDQFDEAPGPEHRAGDNPFDQFDAEPGAKYTGAASEQPETQTSAAGAFARSAERNVLPALSWFPAASAGAEAGGALGAALGGPLAPITGAAGALLGGAAAGVGAASAVSAGQHWAVSKLPDSWQDALGLSDRQQRLDEGEHPVASFLGGLAPYAVTMRPGRADLAELPPNATKFRRILANPVTARVFGGAAMGGMELANEAVGGESVDWRKVAISTGFGVIFNKQTRIGQRLTEIGARPVRRALGLPEPTERPALGPAPETAETAPEPAPGPPAATPETPPVAPEAAPLTAAQASVALLRPGPTVAEAADIKVMGPGITEAVFQGSHKMAESAESSARETARTEQAVLGTGPEPKPDVSAVARQSDPEAFAVYDALRAQKEELGWMVGTPRHLNAVQDAMAKIEPRIAAAHRRAAEIVGGESIEAPSAEPAEPIRYSADLVNTAERAAESGPGPVAEPSVPGPKAESITSAEASAASEAGPSEHKAAIASEERDKLVAAGQPPHVAEASGRIVASFFDTLAKDMDGKLGNALDLYHKEGAEILGPGARSQLAPRTRERGLERESLFQFLAAKGGLRPTPDLKYLTGDVPPVRVRGGFARLYNDKGMATDRALEAAVEAGYIDDVNPTRTGGVENSINDLFDAIRDEAHGNKRWRRGEEPEAAAAEEPEPPPKDRGGAAAEAWDHFLANRQERDTTQVTARGFNGLRGRSGAPLRARSSQKWETGNVVDVGFVKDLLISKSNADGSFTLLSKPDDRGISQSYSAKPHEGLTKESKVDFLEHASLEGPEPEPELHGGEAAEPEGALLQRSEAERGPSDEDWRQVAAEIHRGTPDEELARQFDAVLDAVASGGQSFRDAMKEHGSAELARLFEELSEKEPGELGLGFDARILPPADREAFLRRQWEQHGPDRDWDFDQWRTWDREVKIWNKEHPEKPMPEGDYQFGKNGAFESYFDEKHLAGKKEPFPGAKKANEHFIEEGTPERAAFLSDSDAKRYAGLEDYGLFHEPDDIEQAVKELPAAADSKTEYAAERQLASSLSETETDLDRALENIDINGSVTRMDLSFSDRLDKQLPPGVKATVERWRALKQEVRTRADALTAQVEKALEGVTINGDPVYAMDLAMNPALRSRVPPPIRELMERRDALLGVDRTLLQRGRVTQASIAPRDLLGLPSLVRLSRNADASSFMHEAAHDFLRIMAKYTDHDDAPADFRWRMHKLFEHLGVERAADLDIERLDKGTPEYDRAVAAHEKFARGFEQYLREGIAPSKELASVFQRFKEWLLDIYKTLRGLGEPLSEDLRKFFDRMLTREPQKTIIASERPLAASLADVHESEAATVDPEQAHAAFDHGADEFERAKAEIPPEVYDNYEAEIARVEADQRAANSPAEGGGDAGGAAEVRNARGEPEPAGTGGDTGEPSGEVGGGAGADRAEGSSPRSNEPATERPRQGARDNPLAPEPADSFSAALNLGKKLNVRAGNLSSVPEFIKAINESSDRIEGTGPATEGDMLALADDFAIDARKVDLGHLARMFGGIRDLGGKIRALRIAVAEQAANVHASARAVTATSGDDTVIAYAKEKAQHDMMTSVLSSVSTEWGRAGHAFRSIAAGPKAGEMPDMFLQRETGRTLFQTRREAMLVSQYDTPETVNAFMQNHRKWGAGRRLLEYWINGLISGPATHMTYAIGNEILALQKAGPETTAAALIGAVRKALGRDGDTVRMGEVWAQLKAHGNFAPAMKAGIEAFRTGVTTLLPGEAPNQLALPFQQQGAGVARAATLDEAAKYSDVMREAFGLIRGMKDGIISTAALVKAGGIEGAPLFGLHPSPLGTISDVAFRGVPMLPVGSTIRIPARFIAAIHSFFRASGFSMAKAADAYRFASGEADKAATAGKPFGSADFAAAVAKIHQDPGDARMAAYVQQATNLALMGKGSPFVQALSRLTNTEILGFPILKFVDPFVHIAGNIIDQSIVQRTPVGIFSAEIRADLMGKNGTVNQDMAAARMLVGTGLAVTFGGLAAQGLASGSGPSDPHQSAMWQLGGNQAHSVRVGDLWYAVHALGPMGMLMGVAADLYDVGHAMNTEDGAKVAGMLTHAFTQNILDESFMRGPAELIRALEDSDRYGEQYVRNMLSSFVPFSVGMAQMARAGDPWSRQVRTVMDAVKAKIPGQSETLWPRRDIWGEEMPNHEALVGKGITSIYETRMSRDPVNKAMLDLAIYPAQVERKIRNVQLTDEQHDDFARIAGRLTKMRLNVIVNSPDFQHWPNHVRHDVMAETIKQSRETAAGAVMAKYPQIPRDAYQQKINHLKD